MEAQEQYDTLYDQWGKKMEMRRKMIKSKKRQEEAMAYIVRFRSAIWREIKSILDDPYLAEDAFQETALRFFRYYDNVDTSIDFVVRKYILTIAKNAALKIYKKHKKVCFPQEEESLDVEAQELSVEDIIINKETVQEMIEKVRTLDEKYAMPLILHVVQDKSYKEIAMMLGISIEIVRRRVYYAKGKLKQLIRSQGKEGKE